MSSTINWLADKWYCGELTVREFLTLSKNLRQQAKEIVLALGTPAEKRVVRTLSAQWTTRGRIPMKRETIKVDRYYSY